MTITPQEREIAPRILSEALPFMRRYLIKGLSLGALK